MEIVVVLTKILVYRSDLNIQERKQYLTLASVCIKSVTSPSSRYEMLNLQKDLEYNMSLLNKESLA